MSQLWLQLISPFHVMSSSCWHEDLTPSLLILQSSMALARFLYAPLSSLCSCCYVLGIAISRNMNILVFLYCSFVPDATPFAASHPGPNPEGTFIPFTHLSRLIYYVFTLHYSRNFIILV